MAIDLFTVHRNKSTKAYFEWQGIKNDNISSLITSRWPRSSLVLEVLQGFRPSPRVGILNTLRLMAPLRLIEDHACDGWWWWWCCCCCCYRKHHLPQQQPAWRQRGQRAEEPQAADHRENPGAADQRKGNLDQAVRCIHSNTVDCLMGYKNAMIYSASAKLCSVYDCFFFLSWMPEQLKRWVLLAPGVSVISHYKLFQNCHVTKIEIGTVGTVRCVGWLSDLVDLMYDNFSHMTILKQLEMVNHAHTWWYNRAPLKKTWGWVDKSIFSK